MAAPSSTSWGTVTTGNGYGARTGIYISRSIKNTEVEVTAQLWYWSQYSVSDTANTFYYDWDDHADTSIGSKSINTKSNNGWSTSNQVLIGTYKKKYTRGTAAQTGYFSGRFSTIEYGGGTGADHTVSFTIPALDSYVIKYVANGGSGEMAPDTVRYGTSYTIKNNAFTYAHHKFAGWNTKADGSGTNYSSKITVTGDITLYAQWTPDLHSIVFEGNGGNISGKTSETRTAAYGDTLVGLPTAEKTGSEFLGWNTKADGSGTMYASKIQITGDITLYAVFSDEENSFVRIDGKYQLGTFYIKIDGKYQSGNVLFGKENT